LERIREYATVLSLSRGIYSMVCNDRKNTFVKHTETKYNVHNSAHGNGTFKHVHFYANLLLTNLQLTVT